MAEVSVTQVLPYLDRDVRGEVSPILPPVGRLQGRFASEWSRPGGKRRNVSPLLPPVGELLEGQTI